MRITLFLAAFCFSMTMVIGQNTSEESFYAGEINKMVKIPNSPEAQAFTKYGDTDVNLFSGTTNLQVPLHTFNGREMALPLSVTYDGSGVLVEQMATWVGLSWNLKVGGRISRLVNGLPDDYSAGAYDTYYNNALVATKMDTYIDDYPIIQFSNATAAQQYIEFLHDIKTNHIDSQPDIYSLHALGLNGTIVFDTNDNNKPKVLDNPRIKVTAFTGTNRQILSWKVTGEDGAQYFFEEAEETERLNLSWDQGEPFGDAQTIYASSWLLTKVISPNGKDIFEFSYVDLGYRPNPSLASSAGVNLTEVLINVSNYSAPPPSPPSAVISSVKEHFLSQITYRGKVIANMTRSGRHDVIEQLSNTRLANIQLYDLTGAPLKSIDFDNNDYFNLDNGDPATKNNLDIRLKLNGIEINDENGTAIEKYAFEYNNPNGLPSRDSRGQDYLGYYNGANSNSSLYPKVEIENFTFSGANRTPEHSSSKIGLLNKVTYPTGGHTTFDYEPHTRWQTTTQEITEFSLYATANSGTPTNTNFMYDDGFLCDDAFYQPKVVTKGFQIVEAGTYNIVHTTTTGKSVAIINTAGGKNFCEFQSNPHIIYSNNNTNQMVTLQPGRYKSVLLLSPKTPGQSYGNSTFSVTRQVVNVFTNNANIGGHRIAQITDYTSDGNPALIKEYNYERDGRSTAVRNYVPVLHKLRSSNDSDGGRTVLERYTAFTKGSEPYVVYGSVTETRKDMLGNTNGSTIYNFYNGPKGSRPNLNAPFETVYYPNIAPGNPSSKYQLSAALDTLAIETYEYFETVQRPIKVKGMVTYANPDYFGKAIFFKEHNVNTSNYYVTIERLDQWDCSGGTGSPTVGATLCVVPDYITNPQNYGYAGYLTDPKYGPIDMRTSFYHGAYGGMSKVVTQTILETESGTTEIHETNQETTYDLSLYRPKTIKNTDSKNTHYEVTNTYADEQGLTALVNQNKLSTVVQQATSRIDANGNVLGFVSGQKQDYYTVGNIGLPSAIYTSKNGTATTDFEERVNITYYGNGNVKEANPKDGPTTAYVWGYEDMYPVAKVENATYSDVTATGVDLSVLNSLTSSTASKRTELQKVRSGLSNAMVTTYTYDPLIGLTSSTDPRGYTLFYEYDDFKRLKRVKDQDGNLIQEHEYNYKNQ